MACKVSAALRLGFGFSSGGPLLRRSLGNGRHGLLCGLDAAGKDFLLDSWHSFFCGIYALSEVSCSADIFLV